MTFSEKLIRLRKIKGITQDEFAAIVGVSRQAVYKWESGKSYPEVQKLLEIKSLFSISIDDLLDENFEIELPKKKRKKRLSAEKKREIENRIEKELIEEKMIQEKPVQSEAPAAVAEEEKIPVAVAQTAAPAPASEPVAAAPVSEPVAEPVSEPVETPQEAAEQKKVGLFGRLFGRK